MNVSPEHLSDSYAFLLRETRGMRRDQANARDAWYGALKVEGKEELLFELEMLLKGIACFSNPRNQPGSPHQGPGRDCRKEFAIVRDALARVLSLIRKLQGERANATTFARYLETVIPEDVERGRLIREQLKQDTPHESLFALRHCFEDLVEIGDNIQRLGRVSNRLYDAFVHQILREVGRNVFFNPLVPLEFRVEYDRIRDAKVLEALEMARTDAAQRVAALAFLTLFRSFRYLEISERCITERSKPQLALLILAVLRSDLRALCRYLLRDAGIAMANEFEQTLMDVSAPEMHEHHEELQAIAESLSSMRRGGEHLATMIRIELRLTFDREIPSLEQGLDDSLLGAELLDAAEALRATLRHAIGTLCLELQPDSEPPTLGGTEGSSRAMSERLRRDSWMFSQILRAFLAKARAMGEVGDEWSEASDFHFVRELGHHFRTLASPMLRGSDYPDLDSFLETLAILDDIDRLDSERLFGAIMQCEALKTHLDELFETIGQRPELAESPFDRRLAVESLKAYLGA